MEASHCHSPSLWIIGSRFRSRRSTAVDPVSLRRRDRCLIGNRRLKKRVSAIGELGAAGAEPVQADITWQIIVGALAGVTPFVVAGIEFSKRIIAQRRCEVCGGSGLVLEDEDYYRCPGCGGFLPWQSWKRFFTS